MKGCLTLVIVLAFVKLCVSQPDERLLLKKAIERSVAKGFKTVTKCYEAGSSYTAMFITFSKKGFAEKVYFSGSTECVDASKNEIEQQLLYSLSETIILDRKAFSNTYIEVLMLISKEDEKEKTLERSLNWESLSADLDVSVLKDKHLKYVIPIETLIYPTQH